jgi:hypothetical protein
MRAMPILANAIGRVVKMGAGATMMRCGKGSIGHDNIFIAEAENIF